jgi:hypothetical protein
MSMIHDLAEYDPDIARRLVSSDPFLRYTVVRHARESEEHWLRQVFDLEIRSDPCLMSSYRALGVLRGRVKT